MFLDYRMKFDRYGVSKTNSETEQVVEEAETVNKTETAEATEATEATETDAVIEVCWQKLRDQAERFGMADEEAKAFLDGMARELSKKEPNVEAFWDLSNKLESLKAKEASQKSLISEQKPETKPAAPAKSEAEKVETKVETKSEVKKAKIETKTEEKPGTAETKVETKRGPMTKKERKKMKVAKTAESTKHEEGEKTNFSRKLRHAKEDQIYDARVASVLQAIVIAAASGNTVEVLKLAEELAKATNTVSFCTLKSSGEKKILLLSQGLENVPNGKKILNFYLGMTSQTASGESRKFATFSREIFEELSGISADKAEIIKVVVKDKKPSHTPPVLEDYL